MVTVQPGAATVEISIEVSHKSGNHVADDPDIQLIFIYPKKSISHLEIYFHLFIVRKK